MGTLAVSRSIGDLHLRQWISAEPEIRKLPITSDSEFLIMASDGLWEKVEMHPLWQQKKLRDYCSNVKIHVSAYSPLGSSGTYYGTNAAMENTVVNEGLTSCKQNPCS